MLARQADVRVNKFSVQNLANMAWAFARMKLFQKNLFAALVRRAERRVSYFNVLQLPSSYGMSSCNSEPVEPEAFHALGAGC